MTGLSVQDTKALEKPTAAKSLSRKWLGDHPKIKVSVNNKTVPRQFFGELTKDNQINPKFT